MLSKLHKGSMSRRGATILEYVILAVGIAIFATFGILMFGKVASGKMNEATQVLSGEVAADVHQDTTAGDAQESADDLGTRTGDMTGRD